MEQKFLSLQFEPEQMIRLLGVQLYDTPLAMLRENVQNAADAIRMRSLNDKDYSPQIRVDISDEKVVITDNGVGMTEDVIRNNFWKAGNSGKNTDEAREAGVVGHFGIGALANFGVCSVLEVKTKPYLSNIIHYTKAERSKIDGENILLQTSEDIDTEYGTVITATLLNQGSVTVQSTIDYLSVYVAYLDIPVYVNGQLISKNELNIEKARANSTYLNSHYTDDIVEFDYELSFNNYQPLAPQLKVTNIKLYHVERRGYVYITVVRNNNEIMGYHNRFGLARLNVSSAFNFSGIMDFDFLTPTAGREAISKESNSDAQIILSRLDDFWASIISQYTVVDGYGDFQIYAAYHFSLDLIKNIQIPCLNYSDDSIAIRDIKDPTQFIYYAGNSQDTINRYKSSDKVFLHLAQENPKRRLHKKIMEELHIEEVGNKVDIDILEPKDLTLDELMLLSEIKRVIEEDYILTNFDVRFANISMGVLYMAKAEGKGFTIYIQRRCSDVNNILGSYRTSYSLFTPLVKDFIRTSLYQQFASFIPRDKSTRAIYINNIFSRNREEVVLTKEDYGEIESMLEKFKKNEIHSDEIIDYVKHKAVRKNFEELGRNEVGDVSKVVRTAVEPKEKESQQEPSDELVAQPSILELDQTTKKQLLEAGYETPVLNNFRKFIALTDKANKDYRPFFLLPHTTKVIWSMHRIIYVFTDMMSTVTLYYEMELTKKIPERLTSGKPILSTTIVTKDKIFVPIVRELDDYFDIADDAKLRFYVHYDKVIG